MKNILPVSILFIALLLCGCSGKHLINDPVLLKRVESDFGYVVKTASGRGDEFSGLDKLNLSAERLDAARFLIAYSPLSDIATLSRNYFLENADIALQARKERPWGKTIPESIFLHYVLPFRVNNENPDDFRTTYYSEISGRIKGLDARDAALEVNHWCHEKVTYQPSDIRTSAPMSTILSARGRCGEESTFTVAALRTAGIPARQVYTPRWAHSDDNHAWVEVWIDGNWYYMGACEPDAVLDRGWFTEPARRAMLIHTRSFGTPFGEPGMMTSARSYSMINNLSKYAVTKTVVAKVLDSSKVPVTGAIVEFQLYNYAEFYPLVKLLTNRDGICSFETGLGDLLVWARKGDDFDYSHITVNNVDTITLVLNRKPLSEGYTEFDLGVPVVRTPFPGPDQELVKKNAERIEAENNKRQEYINSWMKPSDAVVLANQLKLDTSRVKKVIAQSMGNYNEISGYLKDVAGKDPEKGLTLLEKISDKDLRDAKKEVLLDHFNNAIVPEGLSSKDTLFTNYILNPRVANELLTPWRSLLSASDSSSVHKFSPAEIVDFVKKNIQVNDSDNYYNTPITPPGTDKLRMADSFSREIYFVALCRTFGVPARLEPGTNIPQYFKDGRWVDTDFRGASNGNTERAYLKLASTDKEPVPEYYTHFTLARFEGGKYVTLEYDYNMKITDIRGELPLLPGYYMLVTGNRISDSRILSSISFFSLAAGEHRTLNVKLRHESTPLTILGKVDLKSGFEGSDGMRKDLSEFAGKGFVLAWIEPDMEPTKHILNDLPLLKNELDKWGGPFIFLSDKPGAGTISLKDLPALSITGFDKDSEILKQLCVGNSCTNIRFPLVVLVNRKGEIIFRSEGYRIGIGEQLLRNTRLM